MTAADRREELEAAVRRRLANAHARPGEKDDSAAVAEVLTAAGTYAAAVAAEELDRYDGSRRLAAASAEAFPNRRTP